MATYKQKSIRIPRQEYASDSEETSASEKEWMVFGPRDNKETRVSTSSQNASEDDDWHYVSDNASRIDENASALESISEISSGFNSEADQDVNSQMFSKNKGFIRLMPSHDGAGNFFNHDYEDPNISRQAKSGQANSFEKKLLSSEASNILTGIRTDVKDSAILNQAPSEFDVSDSSETKNRSSVSHQLPNILLNQAESLSPNDFKNTPNQISNLEHKEKSNPSSLSRLFNISPFPSLSVCEKTIDGINLSDDRSIRISRSKNNELMSSDPMSIKFSPTIPKDNLNQMLSNESEQRDNSSSEESSNAFSVRTPQPLNDTSSLLSTIWTSFRRFTWNIINSDVELSNDLSPGISVPFGSSNPHFSGLTSVITGTGENRYTYDSCYLPFGNHLTFSDLGFFPFVERETARNSTSKHQDSLSCHGKRAKSFIATTTTKKPWTPTSSSTKSKNFVSRGSGSDCRLESGRTRKLASNIEPCYKFEQKCSPESLGSLTFYSIILLKSRAFASLQASSSLLNSEEILNVKRPNKASVEEICERLAEVALEGKDNRKKLQENARLNVDQSVISTKVEAAKISRPPTLGNTNLRDRVVQNNYREFQDSPSTNLSSTIIPSTVYPSSHHVFNNRDTKGKVPLYYVRDKANEKPTFSYIDENSSAVNQHDGIYSIRPRAFQTTSHLVFPHSLQPSACLQKQTASCILCKIGCVLLKPCGHRMCEACAHKLRTSTVKSLSRTYSECPFCTTSIVEFKKILTNETEVNVSYRTPRHPEESSQATQNPKKDSVNPTQSDVALSQKSVSNPYPTPPSSDEKVQVVLKRLEEEISCPITWAFPGYTPPLIPPVQSTVIGNRSQQVAFTELSKLATPHNWPVVKISNIPWDVSLKDIKTFFSNFQMPDPCTYAQCIHIIMDRTTGKTLSEAFIELVTPADAHRAVEMRNMKPLKGRLISCTRSSQEDLMKTIFPKWKGSFNGCNAVITAEMKETTSVTVPNIPLVTREEMNALLVVCRNYKLHFSRKCAERPFENIITVLVKFPFHQSDLYTTLQRDLLFEMLKLAIESLKIHLSKEYHRIEETLLERMLHAGILTPVFTERQKMMILQVTGLKLPPDLQDLLAPIKKEEDNGQVSEATLMKTTSNATPSEDEQYLPSLIFSKSPSEIAPRYQGDFDPFRDDHEMRNNFIRDTLKVAQTKTSAASRLPPPPSFQYRSFQPFYPLTELSNPLKWSDLEEQPIKKSSSESQGDKTQKFSLLPSIQQLFPEARLYFDTGNNPFLVDDDHQRKTWQ
ncbi:hypothetical protein G9A89_012979 [Geosiphon pyriformis]|nr:hypothetical protein G9A89_012979 [Geosiphon pyriformis]